MKKRIHIYIIYLALFSFVVAGVSLSRYTKTIAGSESAMAASPVIAYQPDSMTLNGAPVEISESSLSIGDLVPGDVLVYHFDIRNYNGTAINQVLMKYRVSVVFSPAPSNIPVTCDLTPDGVYQSAGENWTYMGFDAEETHSYTLTISWDEADYDPAYMNQQQDIQIQIDAEQADSFA
jgi:hypothetical protein